MKIILSCFRLFLVLTVLTGVVYPLLVTALAQVFFRAQAEGSLLKRDGKLVGSVLLAQKTTSPRYFWPRPSAGDYATVASSASNLGPTSDTLRRAISDRATQFRAASGLTGNSVVPDDMITASASGLDPDISPEAARAQIDRVAKARGFSPDQTQRLTAEVERQVQKPQFGFLGEPRVNVLLLNLATDRLK